MRKVESYLIGVVFLASGVLHLVKPQIYEQIMPPYLPAHREIVYVSGVFELLGGAGVFVPQTRTFAGYGLIALLLAVFPANIYMATDAQKFAKILPAWALWARLPLQFLLIWWIYNASVKRA